MPRSKPILLYLPGAKTLAQKTHAILGKAWQLIPFNVRYFDDGELKVFLPMGRENSVRGADAYVMQVVQFGYPHTRQDIFWELLTAVYTLTECSANYRTAITPWYAYACQDKKRMREPITARLAAQCLTDAGATQVITIDPHNDAIECFFDPRYCIFNGLYASELLIQYLQEKYQILERKNDFVASAVDEGGGRRIKHISKHKGLSPVLPTKIRDYETGKVVEVIINEDVSGKIAVVFDDMLRSGNSFIETALALHKKGAQKIILAATHPDF
mgnify:CR=1 FL=1